MPDNQPQTKKRILLTGAAGHIGSAFFAAMADRYLFRLADQRVTSLPDEVSQDHEFCQIDIADLEACQEACRDRDTVVHLAADANSHADFYASLLRNNIQGTYNIFRAAKDQGCRRVIFASTVQVVATYPPDVQAHPDSPLRPRNMYSVSKCFGEAVASYFAYTEGLSSIAVRIGAYDAKANATHGLRQEPNPMNLAAYVSERDLNQLLMRCIETPDVLFAVVHGISNNRFKRLDITSTRDLVGYDPQDDAFELFMDDIPAWLRG
jgi:nucleoside-diphosphate-sugar epimerase